MPSEYLCKTGHQKVSCFSEKNKIELTVQRYLFKVLRDTCKFFAESPNVLRFSVLPVHLNGMAMLNCKQDSHMH